MYVCMWVCIHSLMYVNRERRGGRIKMDSNALCQFVYNICWTTDWISMYFMERGMLRKFCELDCIYYEITCTRVHGLTCLDTRTYARPHIKLCPKISEIADGDSPSRWARVCVCMCLHVYVSLWFKVLTRPSLPLWSTTHPNFTTRDLGLISRTVRSECTT